MNGSDVVFSNGDDYPPDSPVLVPRRVELRISPSPPPPVTEIKNSLGDAVLIRHMDNGRDPDIAHYEAERDYSDSSHLDEGDAGEGDPLPEPERAGDGDSDTSIDDMPDMPDLRPHATAASPRRESITQWHFGAVAAPERTLSPAPAPQEYYTSMGIMDSDGDTPNTPPEDERRRNEGRDETSPRFAATSNRSPERATGQDAGGMPSSPRHTHQGPPPVADDMADLATRAVAQTEMLRRHSTSQTSPTAGLERTPLPGARTDRSAPRLELMRKSQPSPRLSPRHIEPLQQPRRIDPVPTPGEPTVHSPLFNGDQPLSSSGAYLPSTTYDSKSALVSVSSELAPSFTRLPPPPAILPVPKRQTSNYSSSAPPSGFHVKLSPITSDHSGGRGSAQGSHDHAHGSGTSPSTGTSLPSIHSVINEMIHVEERPPPFAPPPASHPFSRMASHASPPGPTSPHSSTSHYITSPSSSSYTGSRRSTLDLGTEATSAGVAGQPPTLPSIHPQLRRPLPDATSTRMPSGSMAPALAPARPAADSSNVMYRRHLQDIALAAKPALAPHRPMQQPNLAPNTNNAQGPPKQRPLQQNQNHQNQNQNQNQNQGQNGGASSSQGTYRCLVPGCKAQPFVTQYLLNSHANVHSDDRPHYCPEKDCPRSQLGNGFKRKNEMIRHGLVHKSPGYVCPFCPDREHKYPRPDNLLRHVRVHHKDKNKDDPELRDVLALRPDGLIRGRRRRN